MPRSGKLATRPESGRGLFLSRDSGGEHDQTPAQYILWARGRAEKLGVEFRGTPAKIDRLIKSGQYHDGEDIFFDFCVKGNQLSRPALDAMKAEIVRDRTISHVFIPRRDRLARPDRAIDGVMLEQELRRLGITLVYMNQTCPPLKRGERENSGELLTSCIEFQESGKFRDDLAEKMIYAQLQLAAQGFTTGGRAPFGFRRNLISAEGKVIRALADGEIVRQKGHHVVWLPGPAEELDLIKRILTMLEKLPASQVARTLTEEGIPSPDAGRLRKDNGVKHPVSGVWHAPMIVNLARNPLLRAVTSYGQRSEGDRRRLTPEGPRLVEDSDYRADNKPKVIRNPQDQVITAKAHFEPLISESQADRLIKILDKRAGSQRGKPRSRDPERNPLGTRVVDMNCGWTMYRCQVGSTFRYTCGAYHQSHGARCAHNHVNGPLLTKFALAAVRQRLFNPEMRDQLAAKLRARLESTPQAATERSQLIQQGENELAEVRQKKTIASRNLSLAESPETFRIVESAVKELVAKEAKLVAEIEQLRRSFSAENTPGEKVAAALALLDRLPELADDDTNFGAVGRLFQEIDLRAFLRFREVRKTKRTVNQLAGGILTIGAAPPPVQIYGGPTGAAVVKADTENNAQTLVTEESGPESQPNPVRGTKSLRNANRDDRI